jgi:hypothetical protein
MYKTLTNIFEAEVAAAAAGDEDHHLAFVTM